MSNALDDKLAGALALAISQRPRANLQQIAPERRDQQGDPQSNCARKDVITMMNGPPLLCSSALFRPRPPPRLLAPGRLTANVMQASFFMFWNTAQWVEIMDDQTTHSRLNFPSRLFMARRWNFPSRAKGPACSVLTCRRNGWSKPMTFCFTPRWSQPTAGNTTAGMESLVDKTFLRGRAVEPCPSLLVHPVKWQSKGEAV
ncbi:hypothetical protein J4732_08045 [Serratia marcescens]|uniref:Uncharacterized protein n=1 Tax=Serratia marcescens TaxID=615 RepID=A0A939NLU4_SERMA|nr:hypothetical protein [Serratia marcescens]